MRPSLKKPAKSKIQKAFKEMRANPEIQTVLEVTKISQKAEKSRLQRLEKSYPNFYKV